MIIEFSVSNFRSIDAEQTLRLYMTGTQGGRLENTVPLKDTCYRLLKTVGVYGANASGKSNLLRALQTLGAMVRASANFHEGEKIRFFEPCSFNSDGENTPTRFEIEFTVPYDGKEIRFLYVLAFNRNSVVFERLSAYFTNRESLLFVRDSTSMGDGLEFGAAYKGGIKRIPCFSNQAYLSVAGRNAGSPELIRRVADYIKTRLITANLNIHRFVQKDDERAWNLVSHIDVGVAGVCLKERDVSEEEFNFSADFPRALKDDILNRARKRIVLSHTDANGETISLDLDEESDGTQKMVRLLPQIVDIILSGGIFIVDELDNSMHPFMAEMIVKLFNDPDVNIGQAQMIFTTHNSNLLSPELMRRDQIWFAEKVHGKSNYYSLDCFDKKLVTPSSPYTRWYLEGRFGAIPSINYAAIVTQLASWRKKGGDNAEEM